MRYWLYSDGNILGPYDPAEMLSLPAFMEDSLVCAETATGDNADDWKAASQINELASAMGSGRAVAAGIAAGVYQLGKNFNAELATESGEFPFGGDKPRDGASYSELLDTIDDILGTRGTGKGPAGPREEDYELAEKFDIRLSRIQEELEAARWEKNLLLEKMRMKELEEKKNRSRIAELEARLRGEMRDVELGARELEQVRHLADLKERSDTLKKIEEIKREELSLEKYLVPEPGSGQFPAAGDKPAAGLEEKSKKLKRLTPEIVELKNALEAAEGEGPGPASLKLKSLGQTQSPAYVYGAKPESAQPAPGLPPEPDAADVYASHRDKPLPSPEPAPAAAYKTNNFEPLPQQAGGLVYDFTVVTPKPDSSSQRFNIETRAAPAPAPVSAPAPVPEPAKPQQPMSFAVTPSVPPLEFVPVSALQEPSAPPRSGPSDIQPQNFRAQGQLDSHGQAASFSPSSGQEPASFPTAAEREAPPAYEPVKTLRLSPGDAADLLKQDVKGALPEARYNAGGKASGSAAKKGGRTFITIVAVFGFMAVGGLAYFFLGDGLSFSEFSMLNFDGARKKPAAVEQVQETPVSASTEGQTAGGEQPPAALPAAEASVPPAKEPAQPAVPAEEKPASENIRRALEIVKSYKLAGGRGTIESWFVNSFLSGGAGGANEEWTATPLHGDILVVQYRLLRPKQDPLIYQFEVDAAKGDIVRGINNNAIDLLDASKEKTASAVPVKKPARKPVVRKPAKPRQLSQLPLPDSPQAGGVQEPDPTGFEQPENDDKIKYLKAQESDEELF